MKKESAWDVLPLVRVGIAVAALSCAGFAARGQTATYDPKLTAATNRAEYLALHTWSVATNSVNAGLLLVRHIPTNGLVDLEFEVALLSRLKKTYGVWLPKREKRWDFNCVTKPERLCPKQKEGNNSGRD